MIAARAHGLLASATLRSASSGSSHARRCASAAQLPVAASAAGPILRRGIASRSAGPPPLSMRGGDGGMKKSSRAVAAAAGAGAYTEEVDKAIEAVKLASALCQKVQAELVASDTQSKDDSSPVTVADYGAQAVVSWALQRAFPDVPLSMVAEEDSLDLQGDENATIRARITALVNEVIAGSGETMSEEEVMVAIDRGASPGGSEGRHWVLDPIDGTRGFVGGRQYAVCLGMLEGGLPVLGVLGCPNLPQASLADAPADVLDSAAVSGAGSDGVGCIFSAADGQGAWVQPITGGERAAIQVDAVTDPKGARFMESYESRHSAHGVSAAAAEALGITAPPLRLDSQTKYGALARGDASMYMRFPPAGYREKIWDHAAGAVVITEAGGVVTDASGAPLDFGKGRWLDIDRGIIAANPALHPQLLDAVNP